MHYNFYINYFINAIVIYLLKVFINNYSIFEIYSKNSQNENFLEFFIFFWTNYWTIFFFFFFLFFIFFYGFFLNFKIIYNVLVVFLIFIYINDLTSFFNDNAQFQFFNLIFYNQNFLLLNNLNKIHPFFLYVSAAFFVQIVFCQRLAQTFNFVFVNPRVIVKLNLRVLILFYLITVAILLGAWWAEQEQSWNGWWNWDASETLSLGVFFYSISFFHYNFKLNKTLNKALIDSNFFFLNLIFYALVQLNFEQTSHNFGLKFFFFFNNFYYLISLSLMSAYVLLKKNNNFFLLFVSAYILILSNFSYKVFYKYKLYGYTLTFVVLMKVFFVSFIFNFNTKSWVVHTINIFNNVQYFYLENLFVTVSLLFCFFKITFFFNLSLGSSLVLHLIILNFMFSVFLNSNYELMGALPLNNALIFSFNRHFAEFSLNYALELNFFEKKSITNNQNFSAPSVQINYLFNVFENNAAIHKAHFSAFTSFFFKNNKIEIFELNEVHCLFLELFVVFLIMCRVFLTRFE